MLVSRQGLRLRGLLFCLACGACGACNGHGVRRGDRIMTRKGTVQFISLRRAFSMREGQAAALGAYSAAGRNQCGPKARPAAKRGPWGNVLKWRKENWGAGRYRQSAVRARRRFTSARPPGGPFRRIFSASLGCWCSSARFCCTRRSVPFRWPSGQSRRGQSWPGCVPGSWSRG